MKVQWLCIGGPAHGHVFNTVNSMGRLHVRHGRNDHTYDGENYHAHGALFRVGFHSTTTDAQRAEVFRLIRDKRLTPVAGDFPW